jgi:hypothetical protein
MKIFTQDNTSCNKPMYKPRKKTLDIIRLVAYTYRSNNSGTSNLN